MSSVERHPGLRFGVSMSGFGVEGGFNGPGEPANNWVLVEHAGHVEPSGLAVEGWADPEAWIARARSVGVDRLTLGVEWARTEPAEGVVDVAALEGYRRMLAALRAAGIEPTVTLAHLAHPWWLGQEFWLMPGSPERFARHVGDVVDALGGECSSWITLTDPGALARGGWLTGRIPPGRRVAPADRYAVLDNLLCAHLLAARCIHERAPSAAVGLGAGCSPVYDVDRIGLDLLAAPGLEVAPSRLDEWVAMRRREFATAMAAGPDRPPARRAGSAARIAAAAAVSPYGSVAGGAGRRLRRHSPRRLQRLLAESGASGALDFVAVEHPGTLVAGGPATAVGLGAWCEEMASALPGTELRVHASVAGRVRNGAVRQAPVPPRPEAIAAHLDELRAARAAGAAVTEYSYRSLVDEYSLGSYEWRTGLFGVDRARGPRGVRWLETDAAGEDAAGAYAKLIEDHRARDQRSGSAPG